MRLLVITNIYPPQNLGGFGLCIERLTRGLEDIGYNTYVLTGNQSQLGEVEKEKKVERSLRLLGDYKEGVQHIEEEKERKLRQETNLYRIEEVIKWHKPNACLIGNLDLLGKELLDKILSYKIPTIQHIGFMGSPFPGDWLPKDKTFKVAFASGEVKRLFKTMGHKVANFPIVYPPLNSNKAPKERTKEITEEICIGFCGLIMQSKGLHIALEAAARLKRERIPFNLTIAGETFSKQYRTALEKYCEENNIAKNIIWSGFVSPEKLEKFYERIDLLVFPSLYPESFGMVVAEAMTHGVVPISSGIGGAFEVITHKLDGLLVEPGNSKDLYEKIVWCYRNKEKVKEIRKKARKFSLLRFTPKKGAEILNNTFTEMTEKKIKEVETFT
tara:strand:+ start:569 stop:1726 length:1158 start_codon:yes stop_codon:yes gene_type:complete